jgi:hypothetical protein
VNNETTGRATVPGWWDDEQDVETAIADDLTIGAFEMNDFWQERRNIERDLPIAYDQIYSTPTEKQQSLFDLVMSIRSELKPGYTCCVWMNDVCVTYYPSGPDSRQRHFIRSAEEWQTLKVQLHI